ncbi:MAG: acylphosphatase [Candidatus Pacearchaeota archaeon]
MKKAAKFIVKGNVQGVFFRNYIKDKASELDLKGFVRNLENGDVEVVVEGDIDSVDKMYSYCLQGSKHSVVKGVDYTEIPFNDFKSFRILHI